jgi:hypothetical protein
MRRKGLNARHISGGLREMKRIAEASGLAENSTAAKP